MFLKQLNLFCELFLFTNKLFFSKLNLLHKVVSGTTINWFRKQILFEIFSVWCHAHNIFVHLLLIYIIILILFNMRFKSACLKNINIILICAVIWGITHYMITFADGKIMKLIDWILIVLLMLLMYLFWNCNWVSDWDD